MYPSDWSPDERFLTYFRSDPKTQLDQWVLPLFGDRQVFPFLNAEFNESQGQFSPDTKWMAYVSDESGVSQIYVQSFPTLTGKFQISTEGGSQPRWRRDGRELFYVAADHGRPQLGGGAEEMSLTAGRRIGPSMTRGSLRGWHSSCLVTHPLPW